MKKKNKVKRKPPIELKASRIDEACNDACKDPSKGLCPECEEWAESLREIPYQKALD